MSIDPTVMWLLIIGGVALIAVLFGKKYIGPAKGFASLVAIMALGGALVLYAMPYFNVDATDDDDDLTVITSTYDVTCTESEANLTVDNNNRIINWGIGFDSDATPVFANSTGTATLNFTVAWESGPEGPVSLEMGASPYDPDGSSNEYLVDFNSDGTMNALFTKLNSAETAQVTGYEDMNLYIEVADSEWCNVLITLDANSLVGTTSADEMDSFDQSITIAGESWVIHYVLIDIYNA